MFSETVTADLWIPYLFATQLLLRTIPVKTAIDVRIAATPLADHRGAKKRSTGLKRAGMHLPIVSPVACRNEWRVGPRDTGHGQGIVGEKLDRRGSAKEVDLSKYLAH